MQRPNGGTHAFPFRHRAISRQIVLPFGKALEISVKNIRMRFSRSMITVASLILAVAFFSTIDTGADIAAGLWRTDDPGLRARLVDAGYDLPSSPQVASDVTPGTSAKERWIVALSLLVCTVGIINAQLMSVTERFREIGTMKCLGALDRFILRLFLLEAGMQGLAGSLIGGLAGLGIGLLTGLVRFGLPALTHVAMGDLAQTLGVSLAVGAGLSVLGVVYPALVAARMRPVEAMRAHE